MTNTYPPNATVEEKKLEELRLIRCILERRLMADNPIEYRDYQMEKFGPEYKTEARTITETVRLKKQEGTESSMEKTA